ncbi:MAG: F0F1 ATP synthase subunit A [Niabella sp.]|nr:MAG: F0F1 ATP synthase subunit A [Niabella sp.]
MSNIHVSITPETVFHIFETIPVTNSVLTTIFVSTFLVFFSLIIRLGIKFIPGKAQIITESMIGGLYDLTENITGENAKKFFPFIATFFMFILFSNWFGLLPLLGIGVKHEESIIPFLRPATTDLNGTIALALISVITTQIIGIKALGANVHFSKFFNFSSPINFFVGILELVGEISKVISFSFRLFGNIFAGEVLLSVMFFLLPLALPIPFLGLELFVGFIQAAVFSILTLVFFQMAVEKPHH